MNEDYFTPAENAVSEFTEKRSRFIGQICRVESETEVRQFLDEIRRKHHDARHNCWGCVLRAGNFIRCSDDGEPQGTAGQPILQVLQKRGVTDVCCVVTRYFGGILLGAGGLTRAYAKAAKDVLDAAGIMRMELWTQWEFACPYGLFEQMKREISACSGRMISAEYGADVVIRAAFPAGRIEAFQTRLLEISTGTISPVPAGELWQGTVKIV